METLWDVLKDVGKTLFNWHSFIAPAIAGVCSVLYCIIRYPHGEPELKREERHGQFHAE